MANIIIPVIEYTKSALGKMDIPIPSFIDKVLDTIANQRHLIAS